jgi:hypothetical protein
MVSKLALEIGSSPNISVFSRHYYSSGFPCPFIVCNQRCIILKYIQQDATLHNLFYLENALHISGGNSTHHQERKQLV